MNRTKLLCRILFWCVLVVPLGPAYGAVVPDPDFGTDGLTLTNLDRGADEAVAIGVQQDGRIIVAGSSFNGIDRDMAVIRYLPDGRLDPDFLFSAGSSIGGAFGDDGVRSLALDAEGRILLGGYITENGITSAVVVRLLPGGSVDYRFGNEGIVVLDSSGADAEFHDIAVLADGTLLAAGSRTSGTTSHPVIARLLGDGRPDTDFGTSGVILDEEVDGRIYGLAVGSDNSIYVAGFALGEAGRQGLYLSSYSAAGRLKSEFGTDGRVLEYDPVEEIVARDIVLLPDDTIVLAGEVIDETLKRSVMIGRFSAAGRADTELSANGLLVHDAGLNSAAYAAAVLADGTVLAVGFRENEDDADTILLQFSGTELTETGEAAAPVQPEGENPDATAQISIAPLAVSEERFSVQSLAAFSSPQEADLVTTSLAGSDEVALAVATLPDGTVYTAGSSAEGEDASIMVASYSTVGDEGRPVDPVGAVSTQYYEIETAPITDITRVGALTGGTIRLIYSDNQCIEDCVDDCAAGSEDSSGETGTGTASTTVTACEEQCGTTCAAPTVEQRGVVYSVDSRPEYEGSGGTDSGSGSDPGDPAATNGTTGTDTGSGTGTTGTGSSTGSGSTDNPLALDNILNFDNYFVLKGQTEDGSGSGNYTSRIDGANPQTAYFVRAYALLSDGSVIYGNEYYFETDDSCFIATAAFGSVDLVAVRILRQFRDRYLKPYGWGRMIVRYYYHISPPIADMVAASALLRGIVIVVLLPLVILAAFMVYLSVPAQLLLAATVVYRRTISNFLWKGTLLQ